MPAQNTNTLAVQEANEKLQYLEGVKKAIEKELEATKSLPQSPLLDFAIKKIYKKLAKIDKKIQEAQKKLEAKAVAKDLVEQDVLDKLAQAAKDFANGNNDDALDNLEAAGKEAAKDEAHKGIDKINISEGSKEHLKDMAEEIAAGSIQGAVDVLKDGLRDEAGNLIDKHIEDERVAALIKKAVEGVVEGEFEGLLEVLANGVVDIAEDKLIEFVRHLLKLLEQRIYLRIEERLTAEVKNIVEDATALAIEKTGAEKTAQLVATVVRRILRRSLDIIKEEIKILTSEQTLKTLLGVLKDAALQTLQTGLKGRKIKEILVELLGHAEAHPEFKKIIRDLKKRLAEKFLAMAIEQVEYIASEVLDAFLRVHGSWAGPLFTLKRQDVSIGPWWGCVYVDLSASAKLVGEISSKRLGIGAEGFGKVSGNAFMGVGISIKFGLPIVGDIGIAGGVEGRLTVSASLTVGLEVKNSIIHGSIAPFTIDAAFAARIYLETPIPNSILKYVPAILAEATVIKQNVYYPLGKINILQVRTPKYSMTFNMKKGAFVYQGAAGDYDVSLDPRVKTVIKNLKESFEKAADKALDYLDPTNIDLNPFDEEGWIGQYF